VLNHDSATGQHTAIEREAVRKEHAGFGPYELIKNSKSQFSGGYRYFDVKTLAIASKFTKNEMSQAFGEDGAKKFEEAGGGAPGYLAALGCSTLAMKPRDDLLPDLKYLIPAKASLLRKLFKAIVVARFKPEKNLRDEDHHVFSIEDSIVKLSVDFGSKLAQFRYYITVQHAGQKKIIHLSYEDLWCVSGAGWDYLTEENAERSMSVLPDIVPYLVGLARRINAL